MANKIKWRKAKLSLSGHETEYQGCTIHRYSKGMYYVHWTENVHYAAPHSRMSGVIGSLQGARKMIDHLLKREATEDNFVVQRFDLEQGQKIRAKVKMAQRYKDYARALKERHFQYAKHLAEDYNELLKSLGGPEANPGEFYLSMDPDRGLSGADLKKRDKLARLAEKYANQGHYLGRLKNLARITGNRVAYKHAKNLIELHEDCGSKPSGSDGVQVDISRMILSHCANECAFNQDQLNRLWYGIHYNSRDIYDLEFPYSTESDDLHLARSNG